MQEPPGAAWTEHDKQVFQAALAMILASMRGDFDAVNVNALVREHDPDELTEAMMNVASYALTMLATAEGADPVEWTERFVQTSARGFWGDPQP